MGQKLLSIRFNMHIPAVIKKKQKWYVASCPFLDVVSQGDTADEAKKNLIEAITAFMISCHEQSTLDAVLKDCGFELDYSVPTVSNYLEGFEYIDVPLPFIIDMGKPHRWHA